MKPVFYVCFSYILIITLYAVNYYILCCVNQYVINEAYIQTKNKEVPFLCLKSNILIRQKPNFEINALEKMIGYYFYNLHYDYTINCTESVVIFDQNFHLITNKTRFF